MSTDLSVIINELQPAFTGMAKDHEAVTFEKECLFAKQLIFNNKYLFGIAERNVESLRAAVLNVASIGISLNPALKHAYLVPRDGRVCLDVSYMGLCHLAQESGSIRWVQAQIVHQNDEFNFIGMGEKPEHKFSAFGDRGAIVGVYCVAKTSDDDYLTSMMSIEDVNAIRDRSTAWISYKSKGTKCPWATDEKEMIKKTVIKQAAKMWPRSERSYRLYSAIHELNAHEGIEFKDKQEQVDLPPSIDYEKQSELIKSLGEAMALKTKAMTIEEKGKFMTATIGIKSFKELKKKSADEITAMIALCEEAKESGLITVDEIPF